MYINIITADGRTLRAEADKGESLLAVITRAGFYLHAACGGRGVCGKCRVILNGTPVLACDAKASDGDSVTIPHTDGEGLVYYEKSRIAAGDDDTFGIAFDIGTTTLAAALIGLRTGKQYGTYSALNPQRAYGADVISRIKACTDGALAEQRDMIRQAAESAVRTLMSENGISGIPEMTVCGNTTMLSIFCGESPEGIGKYPFTPPFTASREYIGAELSLSPERVFVLDSASAYIGADITCGILSTGMTDKRRVSLLCDMGTNGELALYAGDRLICSSTAAGPAFEGANIECGTGGITGAVSSVYREDGVLKYKTVGGAAPEGICGSGLIDLVSVLLSDGIIDESGAFTDNEAIKDGRFYLCENVWLSQRDVRQFQLAKSAVYSGIVTLIKSAGLALGDIDDVYIAGGLGFYINTENAMRTGIIPGEFKGKIKTVGNSGLAGAVMCLTDAGKRQELEKIAGGCEIYDLNSSPEFNDEYVENMFFPEE